MLSMDDRFSWFLETLKECNKDMVEMSDEDIETYIFEDFDIDIISVFYKDVLKEFRDNGYINDIIYKKATMLRKKVLLLQHKDFWNIESFRKSDEWKEIFMIIDEINEQINLYWVSEDLAYFE